MPIQGPQQPGFYLPQAEYLNLAPNAHIALQGRRRAQTSTIATVPGAGSVDATSTLVIEQGFTGTSGVYIHDCWMLFLPQDESGELRIASAQLVLSTAHSNFGYPIGQPTITTLAPLTQQVGLRDQEKLILSPDISLFSGSADGTLSLSFEVALTNDDPTNPHNMQLVGAIIYTRLDGLQT